MAYDYSDIDNLYNTGLFEFASIFNVNEADLNATASGSGVHLNKNVTIDLNILDRQSGDIDSATDLLSNSYVNNINVDILDITGGTVYPSFLSGYKSNTFSFTEYDNINVFGDYAKHFGIKATVVDRDLSEHVSEFYFYGNNPVISGITIQDSTGTTSHSESKGAKSAVNANGQTGALTATVTFLNNINYVAFDRLEMYSSTTSAEFDPAVNTQAVFARNLTNEGTQSFDIKEGILPNGEDVYLHFLPYGRIDSGEAWTVGPYRFEDNPLATNQYITKDDTGEFLTSGDLEDYLTGEAQSLQDVTTIGSGTTNNITFSGSVYGTGDGNRITTNGVPYLLASSNETTPTLQSVTDNGATTTNLVKLRPVNGAALSINDAVYLQGSSAEGGSLTLESNKFIFNVSGSSDENSAESNEVNSYGSTVVLGTRNKIFGDYDGIVAGTTNIISGSGSNTANYGFVGAGSGMLISESDFSSIVGGADNTIQRQSHYSFIGGGTGNTLDASAYSVIGGGVNNYIQSSEAVQVFGSYISGNTEHNGYIYLSDNDNRTKTPNASDTLFIDFTGGVEVRTGDFRIDAGDLSISGDITTVDSIQFNTGAGTTVGQAQLAWNSEDLTLDLGLDSNVTLQVGQEQLIRVKCVDPSGVYDGMAVYAAGTIGASSNIEVERFTASYTGVDELYFVGVATEDMAENAVGFVTTFGKVREVDGRAFGTGQGIKDPADTGDWVLGDILWVSPNQAGTLTTIKPSAPNRRMAVAMVLAAPNQQNITLMVRAEHGYHLDEIHDIRYNTQADRDLLLWNASDEVWENGTLTSGDITGALGFTPSSTDDQTLNEVLTQGNTSTLGIDVGPITGDYLYIDSYTGFGTDNADASIYMATAGKGISANLGGFARNLIKGSGNTITIGQYTSLIDEITLQAGNSVDGGVITFDTKAVERMRIDGDGKVGIGTTSPNHTLDVETATDDIVASFNSLDNKAAIGIYDNDTQIYLSAENGKGSFGFYVGAHVNNLNIDTNGRVGIGSSSPQSLLSIQGQETHTTGTISYTDALLDIYNDWESNTDEKGAILTFSDNYYDGLNYNKTTRAAIKGGTDTVGNTANGFLAFYTDSLAANTANERMRIDYLGRVGIGTTSPSSPLHIDGGTTSEVLKIEADDNPYLRFVENGADKGYIQYTSNSAYIQNSNVAGALYIRMGSTNTAAFKGDGDFFVNTDTLYVDAANNSVGIGTDSPIAELEVYQSGSDVEMLIHEDAGTHEARLHLRRGGSDWEIINNNDLAFEIEGSEIARFKTNGKFGIGYTSPSYELDVSGSGHFLNDLVVDEDITMGGNIVLTGITSGDITGALGYTPLSSETDDQTLDEVLTQGNVSSQEISVGSITGSGDFYVYGDAGGSLFWDKSVNTLNITHDSDDAGLEIYTTGTSIPTTHQVKIGRASNQYLGIRVDDSSSYIIHRQDETDSTVAYTRNEIWSSSAGEKAWRWYVAANDGTSASEKMELNNSAELTLGGGSNTITNTKVGQWDSAYTYSQVGHLPLGGGTMTGNLNLNNNVNIQLGASNALQLYHNGSHSLISNQIGDLYIRNQTNDGDIKFQADDGSGGDAEYFRLDGGSTLTYFSKPLQIADNEEIFVGSGGDLQIYHDGSNSYIYDSGTGNFKIRTNAFNLMNAANSEIMIDAVENGAVSLYYDNSKKLETTSSGITVTGTTTSANLTLTNIASSSETTALFISSANSVVKRTLGSAAFSATSDFLGATAKAADSDKLDNLDSTQFLRSDADDETTGNLNIQSSDGSKSLRVGDITNDDYVQLSQDTSSSTVRGFTNQYSNASILENLQGSTNQHIVLGDVENGNANTLFGVSVTQAGTAYPKLTLSGAGNATFAGSVTATSLIKSGGTSSQFLKADGSVDSTSYLSLAGGTMSGNITMSSNSIVFDSNNSLSNSFIKSGGTLNVMLDSNNNTTNAALIVEKDSQTAGSGTELFRIQEDGQTIIDGGVGVASSGTLHLRQKGNSESDGLAITSSHATSHRIWKDSSGKLNIGPSSDSDAFVQDLSGNVGIGVTDPDQKLEVAGKIKATSSVPMFILSHTSLTYDHDFYLRNVGDGQMEYRFGGGTKVYFNSHSIRFGDYGGGTGTNASTQDPRIKKLGSGSTIGGLQFDTNNQTRMTIGSSGEVGIGTASPSSKLHVYDTFHPSISVDYITSKIYSSGQAAANGYTRTGLDVETLRTGWFNADATAGNFKIANNHRIGNSSFIGVKSLATLEVNNSYSSVASSGSLTAFYGQVTTTFTSGESPVSNAFGLRLDAPSVAASTSINSYYGIYINGASTSGTITNKYAFVTEAAAGNVGIGTTSPDHTLRVNGDTRLGNLHIKTSDFGAGGTGKTIYADGAGAGVLGFISSTAFDFSNGTTSRLHINSSGNVGIGTTSPSAKLDIQSTTGGQLRVGYDNTYGWNLEHEAATGAFTFKKETSEKVRFTQDGKVGIGTVAPSSLLHISSGSSGDAVLIIETDTDNNNENDNPQLQFKQDGGITIAKAGLEGDAGHTFTNSLANAAYFGNDELAALQLYTNATARLTIDSSGNVGIGTTTPTTVGGTAKLTIDVGATTNAPVTIANGTNDSLYIRRYGASQYQLQTTSGASNTGDLSLQSYGGKVGIGTTSPSNPLHVSVSGDNGVRIDSDSHASLYVNSASSTSQYIRFSENNSAKYWIQSTSGVLRFRPSGTSTVANQVIFDSSGRVGIGVSPSSAELEVNGHFMATTKSFIIDNPKTGGKLQYGVVESDQHSVLVRGKNDTNDIELPEEWEWLVDPDSITVHLTSIGQIQQLFVISQDNKKIKIGGLATNGQYNYTVYGERVDVDKLQVNV